MFFFRPFVYPIKDDSAMNRKIMAKIIEGDRSGALESAVLLEADDGVTAVEILRAEMAAGRRLDFVLMDFVMASNIFDGN